jgi:hypothetical protein
LLKDNVDVAIKHLETNSSDNLVVAVAKGPLPLSFQVEAGAYINAVRSSLDILAATLAERHCPSMVDEAYFPVVGSEGAFPRGNFKGKKFIQSLPAAERAVIESLKPYKGGNEVLYALHNMDVVRKHVRLLSVQIIPRSIMFSWANPAEYPFKPIGTWIGGWNKKP